MARVPVLEPRVSPNIARDPGLNIPDNSGFLDEIGRAAEGVLDLSLRTQRAERSKAVSEAGFGLDADLKQFQLDHLDDPEPETLPARFDDYFQSRQAVHEKALTDVDRQAFNARSSLAGQDFKIRVVELSKDGMTVRDIAEETGISKSTVNRMQKKARADGEID